MDYWTYTRETMDPIYIQKNEAVEDMRTQDASIVGESFANEFKVK